MGETTTKPVPIKIVIVTMFDPPPEAGNWPSELTRWVERVPLPERVAFPLGERDLRLNRDKGVLAAGHRRRQHQGRGDDHGARPRSALRSRPRLLAGRRHRRRQSRTYVARLGGLDRLGDRRRSRTRHRPTRNARRLADGPIAARQVGALPAAAIDPDRDDGVAPRSGAGRLGLPPDAGHRHCPAGVRAQGRGRWPATACGTARSSIVGPRIG